MTRRLKRTVARRCQHCREEFLVTPRNTRRAFCSDSCRWRWHNDRKQGTGDSKSLALTEGHNNTRILGRL